MARLLAIDYGGKRTGLAVTDPSKIIVSPLQTVDTTVLTPFLKDYLNKNKVEKVIVGYPENPDGDRENPIVKQIILFTDNLKRLFPELPVVFYNEEYTSKTAVSVMVSGGFSKKYRQTKGNTDKMAAALILQGWIDENGVD
ncbi:MAG: Holliday junction resolvase RuvX [Bacteroidales bacterium]|jgi:putative Holliday junction resolvase|nr:Holliday junction resolvase RuvX [Bacteroidales bacterium]